MYIWCMSSFIFRRWCETCLICTPPSFRKPWVCLQRSRLEQWRIALLFIHPSCLFWVFYLHILPIFFFQTNKITLALAWLLRDWNSFGKRNSCSNSAFTLPSNYPLAYSSSFIISLYEDFTISKRWELFSLDLKMTKPSFKNSLCVASLYTVLICWVNLKDQHSLFVMLYCVVFNFVTFVSKLYTQD